MNTQEQNPGKLLQRLPKVDAPVGLEQRLRKRIAAGEGKSLQPLAARRSNAPWFPYSIAASIILVMLAGYTAYRSGNSSTSALNSSNQSVSAVTSRPADTSVQASNAGQTPEKRELLAKSSSVVDKGTGNTHRGDPASIMALKLTGGTAMEHTVPRTSQFDDSRQGFAQTASQTYGPPIPYGSVQSRVYSVPSTQRQRTQNANLDSVTRKPAKGKNTGKVRTTDSADSSSGKQ